MLGANLGLLLYGEVSVMGNLVLIDDFDARTGTLNYFVDYDQISHVESDL